MEPPPPLSSCWGHNQPITSDETERDSKPLEAQRKPSTPVLLTKGAKIAQIAQRLAPHTKENPFSPKILLPGSRGLLERDSGSISPPSKNVFIGGGQKNTICTYMYRKNNIYACQTFVFPLKLIPPMQHICLKARTYMYVQRTPQSEFALSGSWRIPARGEVAYIADFRCGRPVPGAERRTNGPKKAFWPDELDMPTRTAKPNCARRPAKPH